MIEVLVCEDSRTYAAALRRTLEHEGDITVVEICATGEAAVAAVPRRRPALVTMDVELPGMSGLEAVEQIMASTPTPIVVLSGHAERSAAAALAAGALDAIPKDDLDLTDPGGVAARAFRRRLRILASARVIRHPRARLRPRAEPASPSRRAAAIGIGASTGGPHALAQLLRALPAGYAIPVLVVQHIGAGFTEALAQWLDRSVEIGVRVAEDGRPLDPGVWIAPEGAHLVVRDTMRMRLERASTGRHVPGADELLHSIADSFASEATAVVLTGMGADGAAGLNAVRRAGGITIAQDEATSAIYGMPKAAAEQGAELILPLEEIGPRLASLRRGGRR